MSIKHGIKIERHNFPLEWVTPEPKYASQGPYYPGKPGGGYTNLGYSHRYLLLVAVLAITAKNTFAAIQLAPCEVG